MSGRGKVDCAIGKKAWCMLKEKHTLILVMREPFQSYKTRIRAHCKRGRRDTFEALPNFEERSRVVNQEGMQE